jgi:LCP family protein required for cell wall assembly
LSNDKIQKKKKKMSTPKKVIIIVLSAVLVIAVSAGIYMYALLSQIKQTDISKPNPVDPGLVPVDKVEQKSKNVENILLFGLDRRGTRGNSRTDAILIITIDKDNQKVKLTSLMRDMYVELPGKGGDRINAAYAYGGPGLAINAVNKNFDLDIKYFASVDFFGLGKLIDKLGGTDINIKQGEIQYANSYIDEMNGIDSKNAVPHITNAGMQHLNGRQTVAYMRIRYYGNADFERTERQRTVLTQLFNKAKKTGVLKFPNLASAILPYVETNMSKTEIIDLGVSSLKFSNKLEQYRLPVDGAFRFQSIDDASVIVPDLQKNTELLHNFIFEKPVK